MEIDSVNQSGRRGPFWEVLARYSNLIGLSVTFEEQGNGNPAVLSVSEVPVASVQWELISMLLR
jgi:hypothetical protein